MPIERRLAPERGRPRARPQPHSVLRQRVEIDEAGLRQRRHVLDQQPDEQIGTPEAEVRKRVIVHRHAAAQPAIDIVALAQPLQSARAAHPLAGGIKPQRQQKPRRCRRMAGPVVPCLDPLLKLAQIEPRHIGPDHAHRMLLPDQTVDVYRPQFDLVALRLAQPRRPACRIGLRPRLRGQFSKQFFASHHSLLRINDRRESHSARNPLHSPTVGQRFTSSEVLGRRPSLEGRRHRSRVYRRSTH